MMWIVLVVVLAALAVDIVMNVKLVRKLEETTKKVEETSKLITGITASTLKNPYYASLEEVKEFLNNNLAQEMNEEQEYLENRRG